MAHRRLTPLAGSSVSAANEGATGDGTPRFRVVRHEDWRKGIRLEQLFWNVIASAARASGETLAGYVHRIAGGSESANSTSDLRVAAARFLVDRLEGLRDAQQPRRIVAAMQSAPIPSFAVTLDRKIYSCNREFMALLHSNLARGDEDGPLDTVHLSFDVPIPRLLEVLGEAEKDAVLCGFRVSTDDAGFSGNARVRLAPAVGEPILVAFVMPGRTGAGGAVARRG